MRGVAAAVIAPAVTGCAVVENGASPLPSRVARPRATCVDASAMATYDTLGGARLVYEVTERPAGFRIEPAFAGQFEGWLAEWNARTGSTARSLRTYGAWLADDGSCDSWHHAGRAFDVARVLGDTGELVSCRYDLWGADPAEGRLAAYWALAASLHAHFAYVLTYRFDAAHANHIHVDNGLSGPERSAFSGRSRVQNQAVQEICRHVWAVPVPDTGQWDAATRDAVRTVLDGLGVRGSLTDQDVWQEFLRASVDHWAASRRST